MALNIDLYFDRLSYFNGLMISNWNMYIVVFLALTGWIIQRNEEFELDQKCILSAIVSVFYLVNLYFFIQYNLEYIKWLRLLTALSYSDIKQLVDSQVIQTVYNAQIHCCMNIALHITFDIASVILIWRYQPKKSSAKLTNESNSHK